jgi:hypothetical protein
VTGFLAGFLISLYQTASEMAPYLLFGFLMAGLLSGVVRPEVVERHLGGKGIKEVLKASAFGVPLPLCSCSVIPMAVSLRRHGASKGSTTAFLISTPQTGIDSILVTFGVLGPVFAVFKAVSAFLSAIFGGGLVSLARTGQVDFKVGQPQFHGGSCGDACAGPDEGGSRLSRIFRYGFVTLPRDISKSLLTGFLAAALIAAVIPDGFFSSLLSNNFFGMLAMMALGIPLHVCATASVPVAAALIAKGFSPGAALVFLMTGPATNAATISAIWHIMGRKTAWLYLLSIALSALASGLLFDAFFRMEGPSGSYGYWEMPEIVNAMSLVALIAVFVYSFVHARLALKKNKGTHSRLAIIKKEGNK